ncbi:MAG: 5-(carboxyamino)imidazole ribonucleotide mutase [Bacillota bacterium]
MDRVDVLVSMGSDSDLPKMKPAYNFFRKMGVAAEFRIALAHRAPELVATICGEASSRGARVIGAAAGLAAHLPGVVAAQTSLPVIGVPRSGLPVGGVDALYSIVQMPPGIPVATVGSDNATNAAVLACKILALSDADLSTKMNDYREEMRERVYARDKKVPVHGPYSEVNQR